MEIQLIINYIIVSLLIDSMGRVHFQEGEIEHHQGHVKQDNLPLDVLHFPSNSNLTLHLGIIAFNHSYSVKFGIKSSVPLKIARQYQQ